MFVRSARMRLLCFYLFLQTVSAHVGFGGHLAGSGVCFRWECLNGKFNFTHVLPQEDEYRHFFKGLFPIEWHTSADYAVETCYTPKATEKYANICPGQALMHCVLDKMIQSCPTMFRNQNDVCARISSMAGNTYMFSQSRFENLRDARPTMQRREAQFIDSYFISKCCNLPQIFNENLLRECGFFEMLHYIERDLNIIRKRWPFRNGPSVQDVTPQTTDGTVIGEVYNFHMLPESTTLPSNTEFSTDADEDDIDDNEVQDPLDCCEQINDFIEPGWRFGCDFKLKWDSKNRLTNRNYTAAIPVNTTEQCEDLTPATSCVLSKMGVINQWGAIDHFEMKYKIRAYSNGKSSYVYDVYNSAFLSLPKYGDLCDSPRKLFNLLDAMLVVCEPAKRRTNRQCNKMFSEIRSSLPNNTRQKLDEVLDGKPNVLYNVGVLPTNAVLHQHSLYFPDPYKSKPAPISRSRIHENVLYDFGALGLLSKPPRVTTIDLKPENKTLVLLPVYQRPSTNSPWINSLHNDGVLRG